MEYSNAKEREMVHRENTYSWHIKFTTIEMKKRSFLFIKLKKHFILNSKRTTRPKNCQNCLKNGKDSTAKKIMIHESLYFMIVLKITRIDILLFIKDDIWSYGRILATYIMKLWKKLKNVIIWEFSKNVLNISILKYILTNMIKNILVAEILDFIYFFLKKKIIIFYNYYKILKERLKKYYALHRIL